MSERPADAVRRYRAFQTDTRPEKEREPGAAAAVVLLWEINMHNQKSRFDHKNIYSLKTPEREEAAVVSCPTA